MVKQPNNKHCCCSAEKDKNINQFKQISTDLISELSAKHKIQVCLGTSCYLRGSALLLQQLTAELGINPGEITPDGKFALEVVRCLGVCAVGPGVMVDEELYPNLQPEDIPKIINRLRQG